MSDGYELDIIHSPEAEVMRQMVTNGFYDRSRIALWMFEVIGREYDDMAKWTRELRNEALPQTCTWSIAIWEFVYGIVPDESLPLEYRRARILAKKTSRPPINPARIEAAVSGLTGCPAQITEHVAPYTFRIDVDESETWGKHFSSIYDYREAIKLLRIIKPSHLSFRYERYVEKEYENAEYTAGAQAACISEYVIGDYMELDAAVTEGSGVYVYTTIKEEFTEYE
jgi:hypothetical protein